MFDKKLLNGKNIVITGGGSGLGKSMASRFVELGANIVITSRRQEVIDSAAKELKKGRNKVIAVQCDVRNPEQVDEMINQAVDKLGTIENTAETELSVASEAKEIALNMNSEVMSMNTDPVFFFKRMFIKNHRF